MPLNCVLEASKLENPITKALSPLSPQGPCEFASTVLRNIARMFCLNSLRSMGDKRVVLANVPSFRFSFQGNMRTYPRFGFRSGGTSECSMYPRSEFWYRRTSHRVLQGAAQRGKFTFIIAALPTLFSCSKMSLFHLKTCTPLKGTP